MVGRSKSASGPFVDANGTPMTEGGHTLVLATSPPMFSPGHNDVFLDTSGRYLMPYHFYDGRRHWHGDVWGMPELQIRELLWSDDGWPLPGLPVQYKIPGPAGSKSPFGQWIHQAQFAQPMLIELRRDGTIAGERSQGKWQLKGDKLILNWARQDEPGAYWTDTVQLAYKGRYYVGRNQSGMVIRGMRLENGER
jgi:arabinan endo-1,5-alpha-L-arabinosidase